MRAFALEDFGQPGSVVELALPEPGPGEVRIRVRAAGLNAFDAFPVSGAYKTTLKVEYPIVPGMDFSGVLDAAGPDVDLPPGSALFGVSAKPVFGRTRWPSSSSCRSGSARPCPAAWTTWSRPPCRSRAAPHSPSRTRSIRNRARSSCSSGPRAAFGSFAIQLLVGRSAHVIAPVRPQNADYARSLGAAQVIDRTAGGIARNVRRGHPHGVDAIVDLASDEAALTAVAALVRPGGIVISTLRSAHDEALAEQGLRAMNVSAAPVPRQAEVADPHGDGRDPPPRDAVVPA